MPHHALSCLKMPWSQRKIEIDDDKKLYPLFDKRMAQEAGHEVTNHLGCRAHVSAIPQQDFGSLKHCGSTVLSFRSVQGSGTEVLDS